jgi:hypothetical protein
MKNGEVRRMTLPLPAQSGNQLIPTPFSLEIEITCRARDGRKSFNVDIIRLDLAGSQPTQAQLAIIAEDYRSLAQSWLILNKRYLGRVSLPLVFYPGTERLFLIVEIDGGRRLIATLRNRLPAPSTSGS